MAKATIKTETKTIEVEVEVVTIEMPREEAQKLRDYIGLAQFSEATWPIHQALRDAGLEPGY